MHMYYASVCRISCFKWHAHFRGCSCYGNHAHFYFWSHTHCEHFGGGVCLCRSWNWFRSRIRRWNWYGTGVTTPLINHLYSKALESAVPTKNCFSPNANFTHFWWKCPKVLPRTAIGSGVIKFMFLFPRVVCHYNSWKVFTLAGRVWTSHVRHMCERKALDSGPDSYMCWNWVSCLWF
jgi:hypothetical protein